MAVLVPLGVGLLDWIENLAYLTRSQRVPAAATIARWTGLTAKWIKAAFLQATMVTTVVVVAYAVADLRGRSAGRAGRARGGRA